MNVTENEARTKWCPHVRTIVYGAEGDSPAVNRDTAHAPFNLNCIGSDCMMWAVTDPDTVEQKHRRGWCGMATVVEVERE